LSPTFGVVIQPPKSPPRLSKLFRVIRRARVEVILGQTEAATLITIKHKSTILTKRRSEQFENNRAYTRNLTRIPHPTPPSKSRTTRATQPIMPHATMPSPGLQAFILCGPGVSLNTFTSSPKDLPKALIPIANRPMVWYPLDWCYRMGVTGMFVLEDRIYDNMG
jgi:hypothetical protein